MAETVPYAGSLVGFESDRYEARADPTTGEVIPAKDVFRVWVSAPEGLGAPVRITVGPEQMRACEVAGFGASVRIVARLGVFREQITRRAVRVEVVEDDQGANAA